MVDLRIEGGLLALERATDGRQVLPDAIDDGLALAQAGGLLLVGHFEDVLDGLLPVFRAFLDNAAGDVGVAQRARDGYLAGVISFSLGQWVVVQVNIQDSCVFCHDSNDFKRLII